MKGEPPGFAPCTLGRGKDGDPATFFAKASGYGYNDMITLPTLTKESILENLSRRFKVPPAARPPPAASRPPPARAPAARATASPPRARACPPSFRGGSLTICTLSPPQYEVVYTYVGDIVVSVNPFKNTGCVGKGIRSKYKGASRRSLPPHIYALVDHAYNEMMRNNMSQSILISGESGAGKTEAMKICLTYIGEVSQTKGKRVSDEVAIRLMQTNPVMEALGNAKTIRNNNSSRFGKHFDVQFSANGVILGAFTSCYLLEKPRIVQHMTGERNYHVFYMLCKAPGPVKSVFNCTKWQDYKINNQKGTIETVETWNDNEEFEAMHEALLKLGFTEEQRDMVYTMFGICMHLGNIDFKPGKEGSEITNPKVLETAAGMLKVDAKVLADAITFKTMGGGKLSTYKVPSMACRTSQPSQTPHI